MRTAGQLLTLQKSVGVAPKPRKASHAGHYGWNLKLETAPGDPGSFSIFLRINATLTEQFSLGIVYEEPGSAPTVLMRLNGDHGRHPNPDGTAIEEGPHLHSPTAAELLLPPPSKQWASGPPTALALGPEHNNLAYAWERLAAEANIQPSEEISNFMSEAQAKLAQLVAEELFS